MAPFNDDWMSSVFASLDPVAIESVGFDFLRAEFTEARGAGTYVQLPAVDDYLHQAADTSNWPAGIRYDPENDGTALASLGTHEHWNDPVNMQYSRNLGTGGGIELVRGDAATSVSGDGAPVVSRMILFQNYPNPFNPRTVVSSQLPVASQVKLAVYDLLGREVTVLADERREAGTYHDTFDGRALASGIYIVRMTAGSFEGSRTMVLLK
jgi:hypothetical protein